MATPGFRPATLFVSILVAAILGFVAHATGVFDSIFTPRGIRAIVVGPDPGKLNYPKVKISKGNGEVAFWVAKVKTDKLRIEFKDEVFEGMTQQPNGRWVPQGCGAARNCYSGNIKDSAAYNDDGYKYWQILIDPSNTEHEADGHIIIER